MIDVRDWSLPAKALGIAGGLCITAAAWSVASSVGVMWMLDRPITSLPISEWWNYAAHLPVPSWTPAENAQATKALKISGIVPTCAMLGLAGAALLMPHKARKAHDGAKWASPSKRRSVGMNRRRGLYLGIADGRYLRIEREPIKHIAIYSATRGGKGVSFVIPMGLTDEAVSLIYFDPKWEAFNATAGWQASQGADVVLFAPLSPTGETAQYNPCAYVRRTKDGKPTVDTWSDIQAIVHSQLPHASKDTNPIWIDTARLSYSGLMGFVSETPDLNFNIGTVLDLIFRADAVAYVSATLAARRDAGRPYSAPVANALRGFLKGESEFLEGVRTTITTNLGIFLDPRVRAATSGNTFNLARMRHERTALYIAVAPNDVDRLQPLLTLLFQQFASLTMAVPPGSDRTMRYGVDMILDEMPRLGKMAGIASAFADIAGYGVRIVAIMQTPAQLRNTFSADGAATILENCKLQIAFGVDSLAVSKELAELFGTQEAERSSVSGGVRGRSTSTSEASAPLISAYQIRQLAPGDALIAHGGIPGVRVRRLRYYDMQPFKRRSSLAPPVIAPIEVNLCYDGEWDGPVPAHLEPGGPPAPARSTGKLRKSKAPVDPVLEADMLASEEKFMSLHEAEATLAALAPDTDLSRMDAGPDAARAVNSEIVEASSSGAKRTRARRAA